MLHAGLCAIPPLYQGSTAVNEQQTVPFEATQLANLLSSDAGFDSPTVAGIVGHLSDSQHEAEAADAIPPTQPSPKTPMEVSRTEPAVSPTLVEMMATPKVRGLLFKDK